MRPEQASFEENMSGIEIEEPARDRILRATSRLFYEQGYPNTGINEILSEAGAFKKSLYIHFPSKIELGKAYVQEQEAFILGTIERIIKRHDRYAEFIASWMRVVRRGIKTSYRYGCPLANLSNQTHDEPELAFTVRAALDRWTTLFRTELLRMSWPHPVNEDQTADFAERILFYYQGAMQLYGMSGDIKYIKRLEHELLRIAEDVRGS